MGKGIFKITLKLIAFFIVVMIAVFAANAAVIIAINIYYNATISDATQAKDAIAAAQNSILIEVFLLILQNAALILVAWLLLTKVDKEKFSLKALGLDVRSDTGKLIILGLVLDLALFVPLVIIMMLMGVSSFVSLGTATYGIVSVLVSFALMAVATIAIGFGEEILFRGYLQNMLTKRYGILLALTVASIIFVAVHILPKFMAGDVEILYFLSIFPISLTLGYLFYATRSLWACVSFHALEDFFALNVFSSGTPTPGTAPLFIFTTPRDIVVSGVRLGNWGDAIGFVLGTIIFLVVVLYFRNKNKTGQNIGHP